MDLVRDKRVKDAYMILTLLGMFRRGELRKDHPLQRKPNRWDNRIRDGVIATILKGEDIDSIKVCEQLVVNCVILWLIDGLQRLTAFESFKNDGFRLGRNIDFPIITFQKATVVNGKYTYENIDYDLRGKKYSDLPIELKERFDNYKIDVVKHLDCTDEEIGYHIRRYNQQKSMNATENAITYMDEIAGQVKEMSSRRFFKECGEYSEKDRNDGAVERIIVEAMMCTFHLNDWKKQTKQIGEYLKNNCEQEDFDEFKNNLLRLEKIVTPETKNIFTVKNSFIWLTLFNKFAETGLEDEKFVEFLNAFNNGLCDVEVDGVSFAKADKEKGTKDKKIIMLKLHILETLMYEFFDLNKDDYDKVNCNEFLNEISDEKITNDDIEFYKDILSDLTIEVDNNSELLNKRNLPSLLAIVWYSTKREIDLDEWIIKFFAENKTYIRNQKKNFEYMKSDLENYLERGA